MDDSTRSQIRRMTKVELWNKMLEVSAMNPAAGSPASEYLGVIQGELEVRLRRVGFLPPLPIPPAPVVEEGAHDV